MTPVIEVEHLHKEYGQTVAVATRLFISEATVKTHLLHIYRKLGVPDRAAAVAAAFNQGLFTRAPDD